MTKKPIVLSLVTLIVGAFLTGCYTTHTATFLGGYKIKVVDAATKRPIAGAQVQLYDSVGQSMGQGTDDQGNMRVAYGLLTIGVPQYDSIVVARDGYVPVAFPLTNGLPHQIELTAIQNPK